MNFIVMLFWGWNKVLVMAVAVMVVAIFILNLLCVWLKRIKQR